MEANINGDIFRADFTFDPTITGVKPYFDIIRYISRILEVTILRNPYSIADGISFIGRKAQVNTARELLRDIIEKVFNETRNTPKDPKSTLHYSEQKSKIKQKAINVYLKMLKEILVVKKTQVNKEYWFEEKKLRQLYISESPALKIRKQFK